jgi:hypothetical protein
VNSAPSETRSPKAANVARRVDTTPARPTHGYNTIDISNNPDLNSFNALA